MVGSRAHAAIKLHDHRGRKWHKARNPPAVSIWFPNFKISWKIIGGKYIVRVSSVLFCNFPPSLLWVQGTLLNCYPKISSLATSLTSRKTLFSNFVKGSFPLGLRKWNQRRLHCLAFNFFSCLPAGMRPWSGACEMLYLFTLSPQFGPILRWDPAVMISEHVHTDGQNNPGSLGTGIQTQCWFIR